MNGSPSAMTRRSAVTQDWHPKRRDWIYSLLAITICFWSAAILKAKSTGSGKTTVEGRIVDPAGLPVPQATVVLNNELTGSPESRTTSGDGLFAFSGVYAGKYSLTARAEGFA